MTLPSSSPLIATWENMVSLVSVTRQRVLSRVRLGKLDELLPVESRTNWGLRRSTTERVGRSIARPMRPIGSAEKNPGQFVCIEFLAEFLNYQLRSTEAGAGRAASASR